MPDFFFLFFYSCVCLTFLVSCARQAEECTVNVLCIRKCDCHTLPVRRSVIRKKGFEALSGREQTDEILKFSADRESFTDYCERGTRGLSRLTSFRVTPHGCKNKSDLDDCKNCKKQSMNESVKFTYSTQSLTPKIISVHVCKVCHKKE